MDHIWPFLWLVSLVNPGDSFQRPAAVVIANRVDSNISVNFRSDNNSCELSDEINYRTHSNHKYYDSFSSF